jgi:hypothetical protein
VVARAVSVGFAEVARDDGSVDGRDDLGQGNALGVASEHVATTHSALGAYEPDTLQDEQYLL